MRENHLQLTNAFVAFNKAEIEQSISARFEQQVQQYPDRLAVKTRHYTFTYEALNQAANRIAHAILRQHSGGVEPVALLLENDAPMIAAILGVLKAGKIYVPLDPSSPQARLAFMLRDAQAALAVTNNAQLALARKLGQDEFQWLNIDDLDARHTPENPGLSLAPDTPAWLHYTSGSTGQPKGVVQNHRNVLHFIMNYSNGFRICAADRLTLLYSCSVNGGAHGIFSALLNGASLHLFHINEEGLSHLPDWLIRHDITIYNSVPTVFRYALDTLTGQERFPHLRLVIMMGEAVSKRDVELYKKYFAPDCIFVNRLGSTETGSIRWYCMDKTTQIDGNTVPVGYPVEDNDIVLLDEMGQVVQDNGIGEIIVKSRYLFPGYWRRPDLTQAAFIPDLEHSEVRAYRTGDLGRLLPDGCLLHLGRKDFQVKIRGYRIEVEAIEAALLTLSAIKHAVVVSQPDPSGDQRLVAYIVPHGYPAPNVTALQHLLAETLPDYMIPAAFVMLEALPQTPNGKIDRRALPAPSRARPVLETTFVAPRTPVEEVLAKIWANILDLECVGRHDSFLELGGNSLLATRVISRVLSTLQVQLPLHALFAAPTVASMAEIIIQHQADRMKPEEVERLLAEVEGFSEDEVRVQLLDAEP